MERYFLHYTEKGVFDLTAFFPSVVIVGPRQAGQISLARHIADQLSHLASAMTDLCRKHLHHLKVRILAPNTVRCLRHTPFSTGYNHSFQGIMTNQCTITFDASETLPELLTTRQR